MQAQFHQQKRRAKPSGSSANGEIPLTLALFPDGGEGITAQRFFCVTLETLLSKREMPSDEEKKLSLRFKKIRGGRMRFCSSIPHQFASNMSSKWWIINMDKRPLSGKWR
jgi:hypothetical protein